MENHIIIGTAVADDVVGVRELLVKTWHDTYDDLYGVERVTELTDTWHAPKALATEIARDDAAFLVTLLKGTVVGHAFALERDNVALLKRLYVLPPFQRQGIGGMLLAKVVRQFSRATRVRLTVEARNVKALSFYRGHGFVVGSETTEEGNLLMERVLGHLHGASPDLRSHFPPGHTDSVEP